jgi:proteasome beta subunit
MENLQSSSNVCDLLSRLPADLPCAFLYYMTTIVGIKTREGVVFVSDKRASKGFFIGSKITQKIAKVDDTVAVAIAGQLSDAEYLIKVAKAERKLMELRRGFPLTVKESASLIANLAYSYNAASFFNH